MVEARRSSVRGDDVIADAQRALARGDLGPVRGLLDGPPNVDSEARLFGVAALPDLEPALESLATTSSVDPAVGVLSALRRLDEIPWMAVALEQQRDEHQQWADEVESLWRALDLLQPAIRADEWPLTSVATMAIVGGLVFRGAVPIEDFDRCVTQAHEAAPDSLQVARWGIHIADVRQDTDPVSYAERQAQEWAPGDPRHAEVVTAHITRYLEQLREQGQSAGPPYWRKPQVSSSVLAANGQFGPSNGAPSSADASNVFAFALPRTTQPHHARTHFERVGGQVLTWPWAVLRSPLDAYKELHGQAQRRGALRRVFGS